MLIRPSTRSSWKRLVVYFSRFVCFVYDYLCKKKTQVSGKTSSQVDGQVPWLCLFRITMFLCLIYMF